MQKLFHEIKTIKQREKDNSFDEQRELLFQSSRFQANLLVTKCMRVILLFLLVFWLLNMFGLFGIDKVLFTVCSVLCGLFLMLPTLLIDVLKLKRRFVDYLVIGCIVMVVGVFCTFINTFAYAILLVPLIIASMYSSVPLVIFTAVINIFMTVISMLLGTMLTLSDAQFAEIMKLEEIISTSLPATCIVIGVSIIACFIAVRNNQMLNRAVDMQIETQRNQKELIYAFAEISENKSKMTGEHIRRVSEYMKILARASGFPEDVVENLATASMLHDIGKLMIDEEILDKPSKLTDEEYSIMKNHVLYGEALLHNTSGDVMELGRNIALQHHEKWDGSGYLGIKGTDIKYPARLMAIADVFDALMSSRYYKDGWTFEDAFNEIVRGSGKHFDPDVVQLFVDHFEEFKKVFEENPDKQKY